MSQLLPVLLAAFVVGGADDRTSEQAAADFLLNALSILLIVLPIWDWRAAWKLGRAAYRKPRFEALTASAISSIATAIAATLAGLLGLNRVEAVLSATPGFLPTWAALTMLALALIVISIPNIYKVRLFTKWERQAAAVKYHKRDSENVAHPHRRWDDPPLEGGIGADGLSRSGDPRPDLRDPRAGEGS